eukprot:SAG31_NODE_1150_length_9648_cov_37.362656_8_plen_234_part_00
MLYRDIGGARYTTTHTYLGDGYTTTYPEDGHALADRPGNSVVSYTPCQGGRQELGFRSFYNWPSRATSAVSLLRPTTSALFDIVDGASLGVYSELRTPRANHFDPQNRYDVLGRSSAVQRGGQHFVIEDTGAFVHVELDPVDISDFRDVQVTAWIYTVIPSLQGSTVVKVWTTSVSANGVSDEIDLFDTDAYEVGGFVDNSWTQLQAPLRKPRRPCPSHLDLSSHASPFFFSL